MGNIPVGQWRLELKQWLGLLVMDAKREEELRYWNSFSVHVWYEPLQELTFPSSFLSYAPPPQLGRAPMARGLWLRQEGFGWRNPG